MSQFVRIDKIVIQQKKAIMNFLVYTSKEIRVIFVHSQLSNEQIEFIL